MLAPMHLLYLFGAGFRMALSSVRNNDLLSSQLARTGMAKKNKKPQTKKDTKPGNTRKCTTTPAACKCATYFRTCLLITSL